MKRICGIAAVIIICAICCALPIAAYAVDENIPGVTSGEPETAGNANSAHTHSWSYTLASTNAPGDTIIATCSGEGSCGAEDTVLTITAPASTVYTGENIYATFGSSQSFCCDGLPPITYEYKVDEDDTYALTMTWSDLGFYRASVTFGDGANAVTASVEYSITREPVEYIDASGEAKTRGVYTVISESNMPKILTTGWYVVEGDVNYPSGVTVRGKVKIIIPDGTSLTATGGEDDAGITVSGDTVSLDIYGQRNSSGKITATGGTYGAGIGGNTNSSGNNITINGGTVIANAGKYGAAIGGGIFGGAANITVNGGYIKCTASYGEKIGPGPGGQAYNICLIGGNYSFRPDSKYVADGYEIDNTDSDSYPYSISKAHVHEWSYNLSTVNTPNDTITAVCSGQIKVCPTTDTTLTIRAPELSGYDGENHYAGFGGVRTFCGGSVPWIKYEYKDSLSGTYEESSNRGVPGYYRASFTLGEGDNARTAYVEYVYAVTNVTLSGNGEGATDGVATGVWDDNVTCGQTNALRSAYTLKGYSTSAGSTEIVLNPDGSLNPNIAGYTDGNGKWILYTESATLYAVWEFSGYKVSFDANLPSGASSSVTGQMQEQIFAEDESRQLAGCAYTLPGYIFGGWSTEPDGSGTVFADLEEVNNLASAGDTYKLYAVWGGIGYTVRFDSNAPAGATVSGQMQDQVFTYDEEQTLTACGYTVTDYVFSGWRTQAGGSVVYTDAQKVKNLSATDNDVVTLYAIWTSSGTQPDETAEYNVVSGAGGTVTKGNSYTLTVKRSKDDDTCFDRFTSVEIDGKELTNGTDYTAHRGSTVITLNSGTIEGLSKGTHTVTVNFSDGKVSAKLTVKAENTSPATGDTGRTGAWAALCAASMLCVAAVAVKGGKKKAQGR